MNQPVNMNQPRDLYVVIANMLAVIPESEVGFRAGLKSRQVSVAYTAPEIIGHRWRETALLVNEYLPYPPVETWQKECAAIFMGHAV